MIHLTARRLARIHAAAFSHDRPWTEAEFVSLKGQKGVFLCTQDEGFAVIRVTLDEAEILTLAVDPPYHSKGIGSDLVRSAMQLARTRGAVSMFLEVAADNHAALKVYTRLGFIETGRRRAYYQRVAGPSADAVVMQGVLTERQTPQ